MDRLSFLRYEECLNIARGVKYADDLNSARNFTIEDNVFAHREAVDARNEVVAMPTHSGLTGKKPKSLI